MSKKPDFAPLAIGDYLVRMNRCEEAKTRNGKGTMLKTGFQVVNGEGKGRLIFHNFMIEHTNKDCQKIGMDQLNYYLKAVGVAGGMEDLGHDVTQLQDYLEIPFIASVVIEEPQEYIDADGNAKTSKARNKITSFKAR